MSDDPLGRDRPDPGDEAPTFDAPWQARAFALAVAITDAESANAGPVDGGSGDEGPGDEGSGDAGSGDESEIPDDDALDWRTFRSELVAEIGAADADRAGPLDAGEGDPDAVETGDGGPDEVYYRQWLAALERVLVDRGLLDPGEFVDRVAEFEAGDRTAHEFVEGDPHAHADRLPEGHAEGSHHDHGEHSHGHDHGGHGHNPDHDDHDGH